MKILFEVKTKKYDRYYIYKTYYVIANSFNQAKTKVENVIIDKDTNKILTDDGSINSDYKLESIESIKIISEEIIM